MPEAPAEVPVSAGLFDFDTEKPTPTSLMTQLANFFLVSLTQVQEAKHTFFYTKQVLIKYQSCLRQYQTYLLYQTFQFSNQ
jgi:hypothetical protein